MTADKHGFSLTQLTSEKIERVKRDPKYKQLTDEDIAFFKSFLPEKCVLERDSMSVSEHTKYVCDWYNMFRANTAVILLPETTEQVSKILKYCNDQLIAVVPQSGNTGASGGSIPVFDEIIISTQNMTKIRKFDELRGDLVCDAGCVLQELDEHLSQAGFQVPLDLPARHICRIGGNIATNAGGIRQMRFGNLHGSIMGLEVVLSDGSIIDNLTTMRKDNAGYHLKNLFLGSEGTLGFITGVSLATAQIRPAVNVFLIALQTFEHVVKAYGLARRELPETIAAFEVLDASTVKVVKDQEFQIPKGSPFPLEKETHPFYVVMETAGKDRDIEDLRANRLLKQLFDKEIILDGQVARTPDEIERFWSWRNNVPKAIVQQGPTSIHFDVSLDLPLLYKLVEDTRAWAIADGMIGRDIVAIYGYGHVGDGNMHLTIPAIREDEAVRTKIDDFVYEWVAEHKGSGSAEHGIGMMKAAYLSYSKSSTIIDNMRKIKNVFDPNGIMNPYKLFPTKEEEEHGESVRKRDHVGC
ncbi:hypothetical protein BDB00DRAFT_846393 [Zychaea mexicana]|uniref:uncharacterized protein n=1 Tax=Zychaea mexicana TaxID=64656 RepID=UPI0022FF374A|nr:uncharacterized protein BDB00DRAFT_846393 [Zychaea mexicana]KAI9488852.1 hypothetical protein BDB00DRAFT_846393 [Zychaea mexicana]